MGANHSLARSMAASTTRMYQPHVHRETTRRERCLTATAFRSQLEDSRILWQR